MASISLKREIAAPPEAVFDLITDHRGYAGLTRLRRSELEREGEPAPNGVGAIRALYAVGPPLREEVVAYEPPSRFSYTVLSGAPIRDHLGTIELAPSEVGTRLTWVVRAIPTVPIGGALVMGAIRLGIGQLVDGVAAAAERRAPS